jgi:hypothetical protein
MKNITLSIMFVLVISTMLVADEWISFDGRDEEAPIYDVIYSTSSLVEIDVEIPGMNRKNIDSYNRVNIPEHTRMDSVGYPELPVVSYLIATPECDNVNFNITLLDSVVIGNMNIYPAPELVEVNNGEYTYLEEQFSLNSAFYGSNEFFPEIRAELVEKGAVRDQHCIRINVYPVKFNPVLQQIVAYSRVNIEMTFDNADGSVYNDVGIFNEVCGGAMINYISNGMSASVSCGSSRDGSVNWIEDVSSLSMGFNGTHCDYLIITHEYFWDNADLNDLATKRDEYNGFDVVIVKTSDIFSPTGEHDLELRDLIKNIFDSGYAGNTFDNKLGYVLLFGDNELYVNGSPFEECVPTHDEGYDVYFSQLTHIGDSYDVYPDILLGRLPVDDAEQVTNVCTKITSYEPINVTPPPEGNYDGWKERMTFVAGEPEQVDVRNGLDLIDNIVEYNDMEIVDFETTLLTHSVPEAGWPTPDYNLAFDYTDPDNSGANTAVMYAEGNLIFTYMGHGNFIPWGVPGLFSYQDIDHPDEDNTHDPQYNNRLPLIFSMACLTGAFQLGDDCMAERFLAYNSIRGAIGFVGASVSSSFSDAEDFFPHLFSALCFNNLGMCGEMVMAAKLETPRLDPLRWNNLFGDPALNILLDEDNIELCDLFCSPFNIVSKNENNQNLQITAGIQNLSYANAVDVDVICTITNEITTDSYEQECTIGLIEGLGGADIQDAVFNFDISSTNPTKFLIEINIDPLNLIDERNDENNTTLDDYIFYREVESFTQSYETELPNTVPITLDNDIFWNGKKISNAGVLQWDSGIETFGMPLQIYNIQDDTNYYFVIDFNTRYKVNKINVDTGNIVVYYEDEDELDINHIFTGDINNDGVLDLIMLKENNTISITNLNFELICNVRNFDNTIQDYALGDLNNDGINELVIVFDNSIGVYRFEDNNLVGGIVINFLNDDSKILLADFRNNGFLNIILFCNRSAESGIIVYDNEYEICNNHRFENVTRIACSIGNINNDNAYEIIGVTNNGSVFKFNHEENYTSLFELEEYWGKSFIFLNNFDNNLNDLEIMLLCNADEGYGKVQKLKCYDLQGNKIFEFYKNPDENFSIPCIANINGNNTIDIIYGQDMSVNYVNDLHNLMQSDILSDFSYNGYIYPKANIYNNNLYSQSVSGMLSEETNYFWYGNVTLHNEITLPANSTLTIYPGTVIKAKENSKLTVYGDLFVNGTNGNPVKFEPNIVGASEDYWQGLEFPEGEGIVELNNVVIKNALLNSAREIMINNGIIINTPVIHDYESLSLSNIDFDNSPIVADLFDGGFYSGNISIQNCNIHNSFVESGIEVTGFPNVDVSNSVIDNCESGIKLWEVGSALISDNIIYNNENYGISVYHSNAKIGEHNLIHNNRVGLFVSRKSNFSLGGSQNEPYQMITNNIQNEVVFEYDCNPAYFRYNMIYDDNHQYSFVKCERVPSNPQNIVHVYDNYWGNAFVPDNDLSPVEIFNYLPIWNPGIPRDSDSGSDEEMYMSAKVNEDIQDFQTAEQIYKQIISTYPESKYAKIAAKELLALKVKSDQDFSGLKLYYETESNMQYDDEMIKLKEFLITHCNIKLEEFQPAITWFEEIITDPPSLADSVFAVIDAGYTYLLMEEDRNQYVGKIPDLKPESRNQFEVKRDELIDMLFGNNEPDNEIPPIYKLALYSNYPNPFNPSTTISFSLPKESNVELSVYNIKGQKVKTLVKGEFESGKHSVIWYGKDNNKKICSSGVYFYQLKVNGKSKAIKKCLLLK